MKKGITNHAWHDNPERAKLAAGRLTLAEIKSKGGKPVGAADTGVIWESKKKLWKAWAYQEYTVEKS